MKEEHIKQLITKYKEGLTTKKEEELLFESLSNEDNSMLKLSTFLKSNRVNFPDNLNDKLWNSFEEKIETKHKKSLWKWGAIASILLVFGFYFNSEYQENQLALKNQALLEEAKRMFLEPKKTIEINEILFEDENLIVYTKTEK